MSTKTIEGDWEFVSDKVSQNKKNKHILRPLISVQQGYDPVKISIKNLSRSDWIVACMIPKGTNNFIR